MTLLYSFLDPSGQSPPTIISSSSNNISLEWIPPSQPNGIITSYTLSNRLPSLTLSSQPIHELGIRFHGAGYARFPANMFNPGFSTTISFRVRTFATNGLLMLYSTVSMSDYIAISFNSSTLQFAFDSGANSPTNILELDVGINDGSWHDISASRIGNQGVLTLDNSDSIQITVEGLDNDIAISSIAVIGGIGPNIQLPGNFPILSVHGFAGCIRDFEFNSEKVDFSSVSSSRQVGVSLPGCPREIETGTHYSGAGFAKFDTSAIGISGATFQISFELKTLESTSTVFALGLNTDTQSSDYIVFSIANSIPTIDLQINGVKRSILLTGENFTPVCDGNWHSFLLKKTATQISMVVDGNSDAISVTTVLELDTLYLGGLDFLSPFYVKLQSEGLLAPNFGGCIRDLEVNDNELDYSYASDIRNVDIDGCPSAAIGDCIAAGINDIFDGNALSYTDTGLTTFIGILFKGYSLTCL